MYNVLGEEIKTLVNKELNIGVYEVNFDVNSLTSGVYFYRLTAISKTGKFIQSKKMVLLK